MKHFYKCTRQLAVIALLFTVKAASAQNVGISASGGTPPNASAGLDIDFTTKGLLIPRVQLSSTADNSTIASPAVSLLVYNLGPGSVTGSTAVVAGYYYNSGTAAIPNWVRLSTGTSGWSTTGNSGTVAGTNFLGTTDPQDFVFKVNNTEYGRIQNAGGVAGHWKIGDATSGTIKAVKQLSLNSYNGTYGSSTLTILNEGAKNGAVFETGPDPVGGVTNPPPLVDLNFKTSNLSGTWSSSLRYETRNGNTWTVDPTPSIFTSVSGTSKPEWQLGYPDNPTLLISSATTATGFADNSALRFGNFGIGVMNPTASLHLRAGTDTYSKGSANAGAPLKFTLGTNLLAPQAGAMEYDGTSLFFTPSSASGRLRSVLTNNAIPGAGQIPIGNGTDFTTASILGTTNQITVTPGVGSITLSLPSTLTLSGLSASSFVRTNTSKALETVAGTDGQLLIGSTGNPPVLGTLTQGAGITIANAPGSITVTNNLSTGISGGQSAIGGTGATDILKLQGTTANGTLTSPAVQVKVGNAGATTAETILNNGNVGIGVIAPSSTLELKGSTGAINTTPLKINQGTLVTTTEGGAIENDGNHLYYTPVSGGPRFQLDRQYTLLANSNQSSPANPASSSSSTGVMMGIPIPITPARSGTLMVTISGDMGNANNNSGGIVQIRYGTGTAPVNGAALIGTPVGGAVRTYETGTFPFSLNSIVGNVTPLTLGVTYWFDLSLAWRGNAGPVSVKDLSISILEL